MKPSVKVFTAFYLNLRSLNMTDSNDNFSNIHDFYHDFLLLFSQKSLTLTIILVVGKGRGITFKVSEECYFNFRKC
jgi:hypothetical protein